MNKHDRLPQKICRKCMHSVRAAVSLRNICRSSDEYLQGVMQRTQKAATNIFKIEKRKDLLLEDSLEDFISDYEELNEEQDDADAEVDSQNSLQDPQNKVGAESQSNKQKQRKSAEKISHTDKYSEVGKHLNSEPSEESICLNMAEKESMQNIEQASKSNENLSDIAEIKMETAEAQDTNLFVDMTASTSEMGEHDFAESPEETDYQNSALPKSTNSDECDEDIELELNAAKPMPPLVKKPCKENYLVTIPKDNYEAEQDDEAQEEEYFYILTDNEIKADFEYDETDSQTARSSRKIIEISANDFIEEDPEEVEMDELSYLMKNEASSASAIKQTTTKQHIITEFGIEYLVDEELSGSKLKKDEDDDGSEIGEFILNTDGKKKSYRRLESSRPKVRKGLNSFVCDICGNTFSGRNLLNYHMRVHRDERNFECE